MQGVSGWCMVVCCSSPSSNPASQGHMVDVPVLLFLHQDRCDIDKIHATGQFCIFKKYIAISSSSLHFSLEILLYNDM